MGFFILMQFGHNCEQVSLLLREVILPRLDAIEGELHELRAVTWPVSQALWDKKMPFMNISMKKRFFTFLDESVIQRLLKAKGKFCNIDDVTVNQEFEMLTSVVVIN